KPEFSVADGKGHVYVNIEDTNELVEIDAAKGTVAKKYSLSPCDGPSGLAIDARSRRLFSVCSNRVMAISDPDTGKVVATPAMGAGSDGAAFDPGTGYAFSSNGDGTLTIVQQTGGKWDVLENIATERGARTIAVDEKTHKVYLPTAKTAPSAGGGRPSFLPNTFKVLVVGKGARAPRPRRPSRPACCARLRRRAPSRSRSPRRWSSCSPRPRPRRRRR